MKGVLSVQARRQLQLPKPSEDVMNFFSKKQHSPREWTDDNL